MSRILAGLFVVISLCCSTACSRPETAAYHEQILALGTLIDVNIYGIDEDKAKLASAEVRSVMEDVHHTWHAWHASLLTRINNGIRSAQPIEIPAKRLELVHDAIAMNRLSHGLFEPGIGKLSELWGFHSDELPTGPPPETSRIAAIIARKPSISSLHINGNKIRSTNSATQLDFGAIAKGYAVDQAIARLRALGIDNAIVNAGGDLRVIGRHGTRPWRIGIRNPRGAGVLASIEVSGDQSIFTSGDYERFYDYNNERFHHIFDPRTGFPARGTRSVTVLTDSATRADAAATALFVAGPGHWQAIATAMGIDRVMLVDDHDRIGMTKKMAARVKFELEPPPEVTISNF